MKRFALIGAGRAGPSLAVALQAAGWSLESCWSRSRLRAEEVASLLGTEARWGEPGLRDVGQASVVIVAVVDDAIAAVSRSLAAVVSAETVVLHTSGSTPSTLMREQGVVGACGSLHPLAALPDIVATGPEAALSRLRGATCGVEGDPRAAALATEMAHDVGSLPVALEANGKALYHGAAVLLSNYLITLFDAAMTMMERAGVERSLGRGMLFELARGALDNAAQSEPWDALTGPIRRGDSATVAAHLEALDGAELHEIGVLYRALLRPTVDLAVRAGLEASVARALVHLADARVGTGDDGGCPDDGEPA